MEEKGLIESYVKEKPPTESGIPRRMYRVTGHGAQVWQAYQAAEASWPVRLGRVYELAEVIPDTDTAAGGVPGAGLAACRFLVAFRSRRPSQGLRAAGEKRENWTTTDFASWGEAKKRAPRHLSAPAERVFDPTIADMQLEWQEVMLHDQKHGGPRSSSRRPSMLLPPSPAS